MNNLSQTIRSFNRFELKYLVTLKQAEYLKEVLSAYLVPDEHGSGFYAISSLYYDSPDLTFFWEKMDGVKFRRKLRIRHYGGDSPMTDDLLVFIEIKQRLDRVTQKRRLLLSYCEALRFCNMRERPECKPQDKPVVDEIESMLWQYNLRPVSVIHYRRYALVSNDFDIGLRVTFDTALNYQPDNLCLHEDPSQLPMLAPDLVVMEIKVNERIPYWLTEVVAANNLRMVRISKYCRSIELSRETPSVRWLMDAI